MPETYAVIPDTPPAWPEGWKGGPAPPSDKWMADLKAASEACLLYWHNVRLRAEFLSHFDYLLGERAAGRPAVMPLVAPPRFNRVEGGIPVAEGPPICPLPTVPEIIVPVEGKSEISWASRAQWGDEVWYAATANDRFPAGQTTPPIMTPDGTRHQFQKFAGFANAGAGHYLQVS